MKKITALISVIMLLFGILVGCGLTANQEDPDLRENEIIDSELIKLNHTVSDANEYFFMDREYALDASNTDTTDAELKKAEEYLLSHILEAESDMCDFTFNIGGKPFKEDMANWVRSLEKEEKDSRTDYTLTFTKSGQPLTVTIKAVLYKEYAIAEWIVYIENTGSERSEYINEFAPLNAVFEASENVMFTTFSGCTSNSSSFKASTEDLIIDKAKSIGGTSGKPSVINAPYFNLQWHNEDAAWGKEGIFVSVGWPGQWNAQVENTGSGVSVIAKQSSFDAYLEPGESVRSPLMTLLFWEKDIMRSQNLWRRWVYNTAMPQPDGEPIPTMTHGNYTFYSTLAQDCTTENQVEAINLWKELGLDIDAWQIDAGWTPLIDGTWSYSVGSWYPDPARFGESLKEIGDACAQAGLEFILWYEPERICEGTEWYEKFKGTDSLIEAPLNNALNLSDDETAAFLQEFLLDSIEKNGVTIYRQDCNLNAGYSVKSYWDRAEFSDDRKGFIENKFVVNYLKYFDAIVEETGTFIDSCATGAMRLDLETTKRGVALWRDDNCYNNTVTQCHTWGINFFMPYSGQATKDTTEAFMKYATRSQLMTYTGFNDWPVKRAVEDKELLGRMQSAISEHKTYAHFLTADYYPLCAFTDSEEDWMAYQFNDYKNGDGIVQVFKRFLSEDTTQKYYLSGLDADTVYRIEDIDTGDYLEATGKQLMVDGIELTILDEMDAKIYYYSPVK